MNIQQVARTNGDKRGVHNCVGLGVGYDFGGPKPKERMASRSSHAPSALLPPPPFMHCRGQRAAHTCAAHLQMKRRHLTSRSHRGGRSIGERRTRGSSTWAHPAPFAGGGGAAVGGEGRHCAHLQRLGSRFICSRFGPD